jgi:transposase
MRAGQIIGTMNGLQVIALDIAKHVFQMHTVNMAMDEIVNVQIKRAKVAGHFANHAPYLVAIEACGGAHHWARELKQTRAHSAAVARIDRLIWLAVQQRGVKFVGTKTAVQQATWHRQRDLRMRDHACWAAVAHFRATAIQNKHGSRKSGLSPTGPRKRRSTVVGAGQDELF